MNRTLHAVSASTQMSTPSDPAAQLTSEQLTVTVASISSLVFFLVILILLAVLYRRDPHCCKARSYQEPQPYLGGYDILAKLPVIPEYALDHPNLDQDMELGLTEVPKLTNAKGVVMEAPPQYYSSRQMLVGSSCNEQNLEMIHDDREAQQSGQLFVIGLPSSYHLSPEGMPPPRLPSYESVRKKDRQRQIHMMIADRFGLNTSVLTEPPPTYEESVRHSVAVTWDSPEIADASLPPVTHTPPDRAHTFSPQCFIPPHLTQESHSALDQV